MLNAGKWARPGIPSHMTSIIFRKKVTVATRGMSVITNYGTHAKSSYIVRSLSGICMYEEVKDLPKVSILLH